MIEVDLELPRIFDPLLDAHRYKVLHGGRAGAKSWQVARVLVVLGTERPLRVLCAREFQKSISESVHYLLEKQIGLLGLERFYEVQKAAIIGRKGTSADGTEFFFAGLKHNINNIKSTESVDICWVEEAQTVSKASWDKLTPTIRKPGSSIWVTFNPELDTDETYRRFVLRKPEGAWVQQVTYKDNPWLSEESRMEMRDTRLHSEDDYQHIWLGKTKAMLEGAVYANELRAARAEDRITRVPYDHAYPVSTSWDFGHHDMTAVWFFQKVGFDFRVIDYHEDRQHLLPHYVKVLQDKAYNYGTDYFPHDADSVQGLHNSIADRFKQQTGRTPVVLPRDPLANGIDALRTLFPRLWFDEERCADGLHALRHYAYAVDEEDAEHRSFGRVPEHSWASHAADALRYLAMSNRAPKRTVELNLIKPERRKIDLHFTKASKQHSWLAR